MYSNLKGIRPLIKTSLLYIDFAVPYGSKDGANETLSKTNFAEILFTVNESNAINPIVKFVFLISKQTAHSRDPESSFTSFRGTLKIRSEDLLRIIIFSGCIYNSGNGGNFESLFCTKSCNFILPEIISFA